MELIKLLKAASFKKDGNVYYINEYTCGEILGVKQALYQVVHTTLSAIPGIVVTCPKAKIDAKTNQGSVFFYLTFEVMDDDSLNVEYNANLLETTI